MKLRNRNAKPGEIEYRKHVFQVQIKQGGKWYALPDDYESRQDAEAEQRRAIRDGAYMARVLECDAVVKVLSEATRASA